MRHFTDCRDGRRERERGSGRRERGSRVREATARLRRARVRIRRAKVRAKGREVEGRGERNRLVHCTFGAIPFCSVFSLVAPVRTGRRKKKRNTHSHRGEPIRINERAAPVSLAPMRAEDTRISFFPVLLCFAFVQMKNYTINKRLYFVVHHLQHERCTDAHSHARSRTHRRSISIGPIAFD